MMSGTFQGQIAFDFAKNGVEFCHDGKDAGLWLIRGDQAILIAKREHGRVTRIPQMAVAVDVTEAGLFVRNYAVGLLHDDGFEIATVGVPPVPGSRMATVFKQIEEGENQTS